MSDLILATLDAGKTTVSAAAMKSLAGKLRGKIAKPGGAGYDDARTIWNAMIDRKPGLVVRCETASDVVAAIRFARENNLLVCVRAGGHNIGGNAVCDGGLMIDLSQMREVKVDKAARRARVAPGATLADVDRETQAVGLALPVGINSTTGIAGMTLGGGFGWTTRKLGLTIDNLISAEIVTADGEQLHVDENEHPDLFWAIRGGGGNFGVVTSFEFKLHELGPQVLAGLVIHPFDNADQLLKDFRDALADAPDELTCWAVMRKAPPLPFLPEEWHGREIVALAICYCGDMAEGEKVTARLRGIGKPIADAVGPVPLVAWQQAFDPLLTPGARNYWKSHDFVELQDATIGLLREAIGNLPGPECEIFVGHVGGAAGRVPLEATAFPQRHSHFVINVHARWREAEMDRKCMDWARGFYEAARPYATGTAYVNFMPADEAGRVETAYGPNYAHLAEVKQRYDPLNFFRMNQNVVPRMKRQVA